MFSKLMKKTIAVAAIAAMTSVMAAVATPWWTIDFDSYTDGAKVSASTETQGTWTQQEDDLSVVTSQSLSLNTQGEDLLWTPNAPAESYDSVILDADVKFVASDVEPTTDNSMQTAIYLKATDDGDVLCVYQATEDGPAWEAKDAFTIADGDTKKVTITIDYSDETPMVTLTIGDTSVEYPVANVADKVSSVAFRGTGVVDNFKAQTSVNVTYVADVDGQGFNTYADALAYLAANGGTLTITGDSAEELSFGELTFTQNATIDLGGREITASFVVDNGVQFSIDNGTVTAPTGKDVIYIKDGKATVGADATLIASTDCAVFMKNLENADAELALDVYGTLVGAEGFGTIQGNGSNMPASVINIYDGASVTNEKDLAIYHPQNGTLTIGKATITGTTGIEMRAGNLVVNEGAFIEGTAEFSATPNGNGSTVLGAAIALSQHTTEQPTSVTVNGGTLKGARAFYQDNLASGTSTSVSATIAAGTTLDGAIEVAEEGFVMPKSEVDGSYTLATADFVVAGMPYDTFADAYDAATDGETIEVYTDFAASEIITIAKSITIDGNDHTLTSTATRAINVSGADGVTIQNLTIVTTGERGINVIQGATNVTIKNVDVTAANYAVNLAASAAGAKVTVVDSTLNGLNVVNVGAANAVVTVDGSTLNCNDDRENDDFAALALNKDATGAQIIATNSTFTVKGDSCVASNGAENGYISINGSTDAVEVDVAYIVSTNDYYEAYTSLAEAIAEAKAGDTVKLLRDVTATEAITIAKDVTIDLNGKTITSAFFVKEGADVTIDNGTLVAANGEDAVTVENGKLTIAKKAIVKATTYGAVRLKNLEDPSAKLELVVDGKIYGTNEGTALVYNNGSNVAKSNITINDDAIINHEADLAIYHPGAGTLTIGAATITGTTGIEMRAGDLVVNGATITAKEGTEFAMTPNGNGSTTVGAAVALSQHSTSLPTSVTVNSGTLTGDVAFYAAGDAEDISATIGKDVDLADGADIVVAEGFEMPKNENGSYTLEAVTYVANVGTEKFKTYAEAFEYVAANGGDLVITGASDETLGVYNITKNATIDLGGLSITTAFVVDGGAQFSINNGTVTAPAGNDVIYIKNGKATVGAGATLVASTDCAVFMKNLDNADAQLALDVYGTLVGAAGFGTIQGNGSNKPASVINIYDGATVTNAADLAIYHPQNGTLTIGKATITGTTGIEMRAGNLVVNGATITATGTYSAEANGNGSTTVGAAVALSQHDTSLPTSVTVKSGTLTGDVAFYAAGDAEDISATIGKDVVLAEGADIVVAEGFVMPEVDGSYTLATANFIVAGMPYDTFAAAYDAAAEGATIEVYTDFAASQIITIAKGITIDGNGHTLTSTAPRAINVSGADGVTIQNLTINASGERGINVIQGATNVTIKNVNVTAANYAVNLAASASGAVVTITDSTLTGLNAFNAGAANAEVTIAGSEIYCNDNSANESYGAISLNQDAAGTKVVVTDSQFYIKGDSFVATNSASGKGATITINGSTEAVENMVAAIDCAGGYSKVFTSLADAFADADAGETVKLIANATEDVTIAATATLDLNGYGATGTFTLTDAAAKLNAAEGLNVVTNVEGYEVVFADGCYSVQKQVVEVEFAPVKTTSIVIDGTTAKLTIGGEYTEVKVYFKETLDAEWTEVVEAKFADGVITVPATTATGFFTVHAR